MQIAIYYTCLEPHYNLTSYFYFIRPGLLNGFSNISCSFPSVYTCSTRKSNNGFWQVSLYILIIAIRTYDFKTAQTFNLVLSTKIRERYPPCYNDIFTNVHPSGWSKSFHDQELFIYIFCFGECFHLTLTQKWPLDLCTILLVSIWYLRRYSKMNSDFP